MAERWGININVVWKTTIVSLSVCLAFLVIICICVTNHVLFLLPGMIFCKKCWHKQFYLKTVELWDINIDVVWKNTIVSLSVYRAFLVITCISVTNHVLFFDPRTIFCKKNADISNFFSKRWNSGYININAVWKTTIVSLSVCRAFFSYNVYLRDKSRSFWAQQNEFLSRNPDISNFFSKWRNAGV